MLDSNGLNPIFDNNGEYNPERARKEQQEREMMDFEKQKASLEALIQEFQKIQKEFAELQNSFIGKYVDSNTTLPPIFDSMGDVNLETALNQQKIVDIDILNKQLARLKEYQSFIVSQQQRLQNTKEGLETKYNTSIGEKESDEILDQQLDIMLNEKVEAMINQPEEPSMALSGNILK